VTTGLRFLQNVQYTVYDFETPKFGTRRLFPRHRNDVVRRRRSNSVATCRRRLYRLCQRPIDGRGAAAAVLAGDISILRRRQKPLWPDPPHYHRADNPHTSALTARARALASRASLFTDARPPRLGRHGNAPASHAVLANRGSAGALVAPPPSRRRSASRSCLRGSVGGPE